MILCTTTNDRQSSNHSLCNSLIFLTIYNLHFLKRVVRYQSISNPQLSISCVVDLAANLDLGAELNVDLVDLYRNDPTGTLESCGGIIDNLQVIKGASINGQTTRAVDETTSKQLMDNNKKVTENLIKPTEGN